MPFVILIPSSKDDALTFAKLTETEVPVRIYSDGSGFKGGIGAAALLYLKDRLVQTLRYYLGTNKEHTVYEAESVGLAMGLHLPKGLNIKLTHPMALGSDSQAVISALGNQRSHPGQYILDNVIQLAEELHKKQDGLMNSTERAELLAEGNTWRGKTQGVTDLQVHWVPGHSEFAPNEKADEEVKKVAQGSSSKAKSLPKFLRKCLPLSISALRQGHIGKLKKCWERRWKDSPRAKLLKSIDNTTLLKKYIKLIAGLDRRQASILFQLQTGHVGLNQHLFRIRKSKTPVCPNCKEHLVVVMVKHFVLGCPQYRQE